MVQIAFKLHIFLRRPRSQRWNYRSMVCDTGASPDKPSVWETLASNTLFPLIYKHRILWKCCKLLVQSGNQWPPITDSNICCLSVLQNCSRKGGFKRSFYFICFQNRIPFDNMQYVKGSPKDPFSKWSQKEIFLRILKCGFDFLTVWTNCRERTQSIWHLYQCVSIAH